MDQRFTVLKDWLENDAEQLKIDTESTRESWSSGVCIVCFVAALLCLPGIMAMGIHSHNTPLFIAFFLVGA